MPSQPPHVNELVESLIKEFGGKEGLAREIKRCYDSASPSRKISLMQFFMKQVEINRSDRDILKDKHV